VTAAQTVLAQDSSCPETCQCKTGGEYDGGVAVNNAGYCNFYCSQWAYCGQGELYKTGEFVDCTGCPAADVNCGGHDAASCTFCPPEESQGTEGGASYCNGDCVWHASTLSCTTNITEEIPYPELDCSYECSTVWGDTCMPQAWVCDYLTDCEDGSDEDEATCVEGWGAEPWDYWADCTDEDYACSTVFGEECIPPHWVCDHIVDCEDESDEDESTCGEGWEDEQFDGWMNATYLGPALYQDAPEYATVPVPIDVETRAEARRKATLLKVREARVKARAETVAKSPVE